ncbi:MAG TPA: NACHT domain-containing protein [Pyrinomonadaceae bacterium]
MTMLRRYLKTLSLIIVATILFLGNFAIDVLAPDAGEFLNQHHQLKSLLWVLLLFCLIATVFLFVREHNAPAARSESAADTVFTTDADQVNRRAMLRIIRRFWIEGVLHKSLWNEVKVILNLKGRPDAVVRHCDLALLRAGQPNTYIPPGTSILKIYRQEQDGLLLLGEPGSGKTTLMLEVAEALLVEAENDSTLPIPIVFNLSAWRTNHTRLDEWLVEQLNRDYGISEKIGSRWVNGDALLLLLDGLDEVAESRRAVCVEAINNYRLKHQKVLRPIVVCCRTREYDEIPKLRFGGAVVIEPLTRQQVDSYLKAGGKALAGLRAVLKDESALYQELFATPLMLNVAVMTYEDQSAAELRRSVMPEERRRRLWDAYIDRMFERKQEELPIYEKAQALDWLAWLGSYLTRKDLQKYLIEGMQPGDLPQPWQRLLVRCLLPILWVGLFFLASRIIIKDEASQILLMLCAVLLVYLSYSRNIELEPIRRFSIWSLRPQGESVRTYMSLGAVLGAVLGAGVVSEVEEAVGQALAGPLGGVVTRVEWQTQMIKGAIVGAIGGAVVAATVGSFDECVLEDTIRPNEGIYHSLRTARLGALLGAALGVSIGAALGAAFASQFIGRVEPVFVSGPSITLAVVAVLSTVIAVIGASAGAVNYGGRSAFQHYLLRLLLWRSRRFPRNITMFLDWSAQRVLVQRVGGGWRFVHRTLQERFAERYYEKYLNER